jgi:hypothetical protein
MSSVLAAPQQIPSRVGYFKVSGVADAGANYSRFIYNAPNFSGATGFVKQVGNEVFFNSYANAVTAVGTNTGLSSAALVDGQILRDMGKTYTILVDGTVPLRVAVITKVAKYGVNGEDSEGVIGNSNTTAGAGANYNTGYVVSWTANPTASSGIPCLVSRTGY